MTKRRHVLVFPAGTEVGNEVLLALQNVKEVRLFGAGQAVSNHAMFSYPEYHQVPSVYQDGWLEILANLCRTLAIDYVIPGHDDTLVALARHAASIPATVISSPVEACETTRSKSLTYRRLEGIVRVPAIFATPGEVRTYPVLVKPDRGQGSWGVQTADCRDALDRACAAITLPIICEYLPGEEYTIDCLSDREKGLLFAGARLRRRTRNGISVNTITTELPGISRTAAAIASALKLRGAWFFQLKRAADGELALLEVAPRIAGSMAAHRVMGVNFPLLSIYEAERLSLSLLVNPGVVELDRGLNNRYRHQIAFDHVYVDLDDTLILNERINPILIQFLYKCLNQKKTLTLLTRHRGNLAETLAKHRIGALFDQIVHLRHDEPKSRYITHSSSILVDDSFAERVEVTKACGIPTLDCSMVEVLVSEADSN